MEVNNPCEGSGLKTTNPVAEKFEDWGTVYFKVSTCTHCKGVRGVTWDFKINRFRFGTHQKEGH